MMNSKQIFAVSLLLFLAQSSLGQEPGMSSPYSFGGACASQGVWTQTALSATQNLRKVALQLRDDPNCRAMGTSIQASIQNLESAINRASDSPARVARLSQLPQEIGALRSFLTSAPDLKQQVLRVMMDKSIESATLSAQVGQDVGMMSQGISDFGSRIQQSTKTGLSILNDVVDSIPKLTECLAEDNQQAVGSAIATAVQVASAFASSGQDATGSQLATTVSKLTTLVRDQKYSKILRKLNKQEFLSSMSCLMEVTSESYCQARVGMQLFKKGMEDLTGRENTGTDVKSGGPFVGYYILNTHVPNITKWLQKIQIGVDPKLPTDAIFQNKIQQEVADFYKGVKTLIGDYNSSLLTIKSMQSFEAKQNAVLKLLVKVSESMSGESGGFSRQDSEHTNFFTMSKNPMRIPFDLVGMGVPDQVSGKAMPQMSFDQWYQANMQDLQVFKDPLALAETIGRNMQEIIRSANISAIEYFNKWYIVDKAALVNESTIDINYTVQDSLKAVNEYLEAEKKRILKYSGNKSIVPTIVDTQIRINSVLKGYDELDKLGTITLNDINSLSQNEKQVQDTANAYEKLVNLVYEQFNVMQSRSGFIANRMVNFVYEDYIMLIKNKVDFTPYQQELYNATGMAAMDKMMQMYNGNPANIQTDLNMALRINKGNIEALEMLLKDSMIRTITELDIIKNDGKASLFGALKSVVKDQHEENMAGKTWYEKSLWISEPYALSKEIFNSFSFWINHSDRYVYSTNDIKNSPQSEFQDAENVKAQLCIQSLAFYDQNAIRNICRGAVLKSPLGKDMVSMNMSYDQKLAEHFNDASLSVQMKKSMNHSERICAFRDYNMRNMAKFMSMGKSFNK